MKKPHTQTDQSTSETFKYFSKKSFFTFCLFACFSFLALTNAKGQTAVERYGQLKVSGTKIVDKNNNPVQLRGMSLFWSQWMPKYYNYNTVKWLRDDWCINVIRVAMGVESGGYQTNPAAEKAKVVAVVDAAIQLGIYVIIDWHDHEAGNKTALAQSFFNEMSAKYKDAPNVLYEVWNEPLNHSWTGVIKPYCESVISTIRKNDPDNIIICGTRTWSQRVDEAANSPINQPNIAYTLHYYADTHKETIRGYARTAISKGICIFVTEYGTCAADGAGAINEAESNAWYAFLDANKISHCNWSVADKAETSAILVPGTGTANWSSGQLTASGRFVRNEIKTKNCVSLPPININPTVTLTGPSNNATFTAPASITLTANASDQDGTVSKVEFFNGTTLIGSDASSPYSFNWTNVTSGTYTITAKATDNAGGTSTTSPITITVGAAGVNPTISITSPASNSNFSAPASITINANASDADGSVTNVEFYNGTQLLGSDQSSPYSFTWNNVASGNYTITAKATDNSGRTATSSPVTITVTAGQAPTISITGPSNNASFTAPGNITITANAADSDGSVTNVEFYNGTQLLGSDQSSPYSFSWNNVAAGTYTITAKATDNSGKSTTSSPVTVVVTSGQAPTVSITSPANDASFTAPGNISITANASDADGSVSRVEFFNGTNLIGSDWSSPYSFDWNNVAAGTYTITAKATDNNNLTTTSSAITIIVRNAQAPTVSITGPANNATFSAPASVNLTANAADADGSVSKVEFFNGANSIGSDASSPYTFNWTNVAAGTYTITAKATDNTGLVTTSSPVTIVVTGPKAPSVNITAPSNNATFTAPATINFSIYASDEDGTVTKVETYNGNELINTDYTFGFGASWKNVPAGTYTVTAKAYDNNGLTTVSSPITIIVKGSPIPTVTITAPLNNVEFASNSTIVLKANASDGDGSITKVEFFNGNNSLGTDFSSPYEYSWANVQPGNYTITVKATDNNGNVTTSSPINITVKAAAPIDCNGVEGGTAATDACGKCSGGNTGRIPVTDPSKCGVTATTTDKKDINVLFYPNPFTNTLTVELEQESTYTVYDLLGTIAEEGKGSGKVELGSNLATGVYVVRIKNNGTEYLIKINKI